MSDAFNQVLLRLKERSGLQNNKDVASLLGIQEKAFTARKARGSFPATELFALAAKRPDLHLDVDYVLTGITTEARAKLDAKQARIERATDAGATIEQIRVMEGDITGPTPARLYALGAMLSGLRVTEFDSIYTLAQSITELRRALGAAAAEPTQNPHTNTP
jgi:hypothetical protein